MSRTYNNQNKKKIKDKIENVSLDKIFPQKTIDKKLINLVTVFRVKPNLGVKVSKDDIHKSRSIENTLKNIITAEKLSKNISNWEVNKEFILSIKNKHNRLNKTEKIYLKTPSFTNNLLNGTLPKSVDRRAKILHGISIHNDKEGKERDITNTNINTSKMEIQEENNTENTVKDNKENNTKQNKIKETNNSVGSIYLMSQFDNSLPPFKIKSKLPPLIEKKTYNYKDKDKRITKVNTSNNDDLLKITNYIFDNETKEKAEKYEKLNRENEEIKNNMYHNKQISHYHSQILNNIEESDEVYYLDNNKINKNNSDISLIVDRRGKTSVLESTYEDGERNINERKSHNHNTVLNKNNNSQIRRKLLNPLNTFNPLNKDYVIDGQGYNPYQLRKEREDKLKSCPIVLKELNDDYTFTYKVINKTDRSRVEPVMKHRINWVIGESNTDCHFIWKYSTKGVSYNKLAIVSNMTSMDKFRVINHFEGHYEITNKRKLFLNLKDYCDLNNLDCFKYIPFTIIFHYSKEHFETNFNSFSSLFTAIEKLKHNSGNSPMQKSQSPVQQFNSNNKYQKLMICSKNNNGDLVFNNSYNNKFKDLIIKDFSIKGIENSNNTLINLNNNRNMVIPSTHYEEKNYWIIKPVDLYQGKCMKLLNNLEKIGKKIKKYFSGVEKNYSDDEEEEDFYINKNDNKNDNNQNNSSFEKNEKDNEINTANKNKRKKRYFSNCVVIQKYIESPLLYNNRKFDIRIWVMVDYNLNVYVFNQGHLKTSSLDYDLDNQNLLIHITNYSLQKKGENFSKFEFGNEVSISQFDQMCRENNVNINFQADIYPKIKKMIDITMKSVAEKLNKKQSMFCFEIYGYDFILDKDFEPWLLEINDNPGLCESSPLLKILVPRMLDDAFRLTLDLIFNTKYADYCYDKNREYKSPYPVENFPDSQNLFDFVCCLSKYSCCLDSEKKSIIWKNKNA